MSKDQDKMDVESDSDYIDLINQISQLKKEIFQLRNLIENLPGDIYWKDKDGVWSGVNKRGEESLHRMGLIPNNYDVIGKTDFELFSQETAELYRKNDLEVMNKQLEITKEEINQLPTGETIVQLSTKRPLWNENGEVVGIVGNTVDISYLKKIEEELRIAKEAAEAASRSKTAFIANISHDTRTPLTGVIGLSSVLEEIGISEDERIKYAKLIHESGEKLLEFSESVLDDVSAETMTDDKVLNESFDVRNMVHDVVALEHPTTEVKNLDIKMHIDESIPAYLVGDKMKIHRILLNLAGNAIKFTNQGGIEINARLCGLQDDNAKVEFSVKDTGIGIAPEHQSKVFDQFYKVSPSYKGHYKGYGLGLHIVQKFVSLLGGEIHLESTPNVGTTISFELTMKIGEKPVVDDHVKSSEPIARRIDVETENKPDSVNTSAHQQIDLNKPQILLVEDNNTAMIVLKTLVNKFDVLVATAVDAEKAFELIQSQPFHLMITDLGLPGKQGDELSRMVRAYEKEHQRQPMMIVGLTGHAVEEIATQCIDAGMNEVYRKPMALQTLTVLMDKLIKPASSFSEKESSSSGGLGVDLPDTEAQLFELNQFPLIDIDVGVRVLGSEEMVRDILKSLKKDAIDDDLALIKQAHAAGDWDTVQSLTHKMKGGSDFGTVRMHYALLYMERYRKAGHTKLSEELYTQMLSVIDETMHYLDEWLNKN